MEHCSDNVWPSTESSSIVDMTTNDLDTLLNADMFSLDLQWYSWDESLPDSIQSQYEVPSIPPLDATRQYSTTSSSSSQPSYEYHCENQILDDSLRFQGINGVNQSSGMSILQPDTGTISSGSIPYQSSPSPVSPDSMSPTGRIYTGEYMTAKQKSLLHRRKQNRESQRTFRQRKEVERIELQERLETAVKACEDLKKQVKRLEEENSSLRRSSQDS